MRHERAVVAVALLAGAMLRLWGLAERPLAPEEAAQAWRATRAASAGEAMSDGVASPLLASGQAVLFFMVEGNTFLARLPAVLCGLALLLVPLAMRDSLGPTRTVALVVIVALDPLLIRTARDAAGASATLLAASLAAAGLVRWARVGRTDAALGRRDAVLTAAAVGALVASGPEAWGFVPLLALLGLAVRPDRACTPPSRRCAAALLGGTLLAATAGLWAISWAAAVSASLTAWLRQVAAPTAGVALQGFAWAPLTVGLALVAILRPARIAGVRFIVVALAWGLFMVTRGAGLVAALSVVLAVAAMEGARVLAERPPRLRWAALPALALSIQLAMAARPVLPNRPLAARPDLETLAADLERIAVLTGREATELSVVVLGEREDPSLRWALRRGRAVSHRPWRDEGDGTAVLVAPAIDPAAPGPRGYVGATYASSAASYNLWVPIDR